MSLFIYCPRKSEGAFELVKAMGATRLRRFDGMDFWGKGRRVSFKEGDAIVCWGTTIPEINGVKVLNSMDSPLNKYQENQKLVTAKLPTLGMVLPDGSTSTRDFIGAGYIPRSFYHQGGNDLLGKKTKIDFWVKRLTLTKEFRIHSFAGKSIRAGEKVHRDGFVEVPEGGWRPNSKQVHPWVRSFDGGWRIKYDGFVSNATLRTIAHNAVKALGLTFGAVDIGQKENGKYVILEVNTAPGIEGGTLDSYVRQITKWVDAPVVEKVETMVAVGMRPPLVKQGDICPRCAFAYSRHQGWNCPDGNGVWPE